MMMRPTQMKPADDATDYTTCGQVCCMHAFCGSCELIQLANVADIRKAKGNPVVTPISNPALMASMAMMQQMQMNNMMMQQQQMQMQQQANMNAAPAAVPAAAPTQ
jgi:hypothetical protein